MDKVLEKFTRTLMKELSLENKEETSTNVSCDRRNTGQRMDRQLILKTCGRMLKEFPCAAFYYKGGFICGEPRKN